MIWQIEGANSQTGQDISIQINASSKDEAIKQAKALGIFVSSIASSKATKTRKFLPSKKLLLLCLLIGVTAITFFLPLYLSNDKATKAIVSFLPVAQTYSLTLKLEIRNTDNADLIPVDQAESYLIRSNNIEQAKASVSEYKESLDGKVELVSEAILKIFEIQKKINALNIEEKETATPPSLADPMAPTEEDIERSQSTVNNLEQIELKKRSLVEQQDETDKAYKKLLADLVTSSNIQSDKLKNSLISLCIKSDKSDSKGFCTFSNVEPGKYVVLVTPDKGIWFFEKEYTINSNINSFLGPDEQQTIGKGQVVDSVK